MLHKTDGYHTFNPVAVAVKTSEGNVIRGEINIGLNERLSDFLNDPKQSSFIVVFEAEAHGKHHQVYFVNRDHIIYVQPDTWAKEHQEKEK